MKCRSELFVLRTEPLKLILCSRSNTVCWQGTRVVRYHTEA